MWKRTIAARSPRIALPGWSARTISSTSTSSPGLASLRRAQPRLLDHARRREKHAEFRLAVAIRPEFEAGVESNRRPCAIGTAHLYLGLARKKRVIGRIGRGPCGGGVHVLELDHGVVRPALVTQRQHVRAIEQR